VEVKTEVERISNDLHPDTAATLDAAFRYATLMYSGTFPGFFSCDTAYQGIQHVLEVTLAIVRLIDGHERSRHRRRADG
jgi:hypothetical protein